MGKLIEITKCNSCPYINHSMFSGNPYCTKTGKEFSLSFLLSNQIPEWCPLKDAPNKASKPERATPSRCISCRTNWIFDDYCRNCGKQRPAT